MTLDSFGKSFRAIKYSINQIETCAKIVTYKLFCQYSTLAMLNIEGIDRKKYRRTKKPIDTVVQSLAVNENG